MVLFIPYRQGKKGGRKEKMKGERKQRKSSAQLEDFLAILTIGLCKAKVSESCSVVSNSLQPHGLHQAKILEWIAFPFSRGSSQPRDQTQVSHIAGRFFTSWATKEAQEYWSGSLSLLQQILPTQESDQCLLHCRQILYQLSYQGSR